MIGEGENRDEEPDRHGVAVTRRELGEKPKPGVYYFVRRRTGGCSSYIHETRYVQEERRAESGEDGPGGEEPSRGGGDTHN